MNVFHYILIFLLGSGIVFYFIASFVASYLIYVRTLKRESKAQWGRTVSCQQPEHLKMHEIGLEWEKANREFKEDVSIVRDGTLYGEYYDFGFEKSIIFFSGRTESLLYGYYFSAPYKESGYNVLLVDTRAHGLSDGEYNTVGFEESKDAIAWAKFLCEQKGVKSIVFHGVCIGSAASLLAITDNDCPECVNGVIAEGMFADFRYAMKNNLLVRKRFLPPVLELIGMWMKIYTGHSFYKGPKDRIGKMHKPLLMLHSKQDRSSSPKKAMEMFEKCPSENKTIVWYDTGAHSMLRITDTEKYDDAVKTFLKRI